jgi:hypothetical protein
MIECKIHQIKHCTICPEVSDPDASMDTMIQQASVPTLATLFRKAKDSGAIKAVTAYGGPTS